MAARSGEVRDAVIVQLKLALPAEAIEAIVVPPWFREQLSDGRRVLVRFAERNLELQQGPDTQQVVIDVGVIGLASERSDSTEPYRTEEVIAVDCLEELMESIIALWMDEGSLSDCVMANHYLVDVQQNFQFDADRFYNHGIYLTMVQLTYQDSRD